MASWGKKLDKKLNALADSASKESMQTLANWIGFNRKHEVVFAKTLCNALLGTTTTSRQWLYWQVLHEVLLGNHNDSTKWERSGELRTTLGESAIVPALEGLGTRVLAEKIETFLTQWDDQNVFGGPTLIGQIRRLLTSASKTTATSGSAPAAAPAPASKASEADASSPAETTGTTGNVDKTEPIKVTAAVATADANTPQAVRRGSLSSVGSAKHSRRGSMSSILSEVEYDFDSKNVPQGKVDSREFLDPCKAVATLQIARDVRTDAPVQLNSMLSNLPKDIVEAAAAQTQKSSTTNEVQEDEGLDAATIRDYSIRIPSKLLELDLDDQFQTIRTFQDIIRQQRTSREQLIHLLLKSRCQFGSQEAAQQFMELEDTSRKLKRRRQLLGDALELEGLDQELDHTDYEKSIQDLPPLSWYPSKEDDSPPSSTKKSRVE